jgi:hypothetical protein
MDELGGKESTEKLTAAAMAMGTAAYPKTKTSPRFVGRMCLDLDGRRSASGALEEAWRRWWRLEGRGGEKP